MSQGKRFPQTVFEIIEKLLDRQDLLIADMGKSCTPEGVLENQEKLYSDFTRGIFFIKEYLSRYRDQLSPEAREDVRQRVREQTKTLDLHYAFLYRSLGRVIGSR